MLIDKQLEASLNGLGLDKKQAMILLARSTLMDGLKSNGSISSYTLDSNQALLPPKLS